MRKNITKQMLKGNVCEKGYEWYLRQNETNAVILIDHLITDKQYGWANRYIPKLLTRKQNAVFAQFIAEQTVIAATKATKFAEVAMRAKRAGDIERATRTTWLAGNALQKKIALYGFELLRGTGK